MLCKSEWKKLWWIKGERKIIRQWIRNQKKKNIEYTYALFSLRVDPRQRWNQRYTLANRRDCAANTLKSASISCEKIDRWGERVLCDAVRKFSETNNETLPRAKYTRPKQQVSKLRTLWFCTHHHPLHILRDDLESPDHSVNWKFSIAEGPAIPRPSYCHHRNPR